MGRGTDELESYIWPLTGETDGARAAAAAAAGVLRGAGR